MTREDVTVDGGKYTFQQPMDDWKIHVLRHGEPWLIIESGSNAISSLLEEIRELREKTEPPEPLYHPQGKDLCYGCGELKEDHPNPVGCTVWHLGEPGR